MQTSMRSELKVPSAHGAAGGNRKKGRVGCLCGGPKMVCRERAHGQHKWSPIKHWGQMARVVAGMVRSEGRIRQGQQKAWGTECVCKTKHGGLGKTEQHSTCMHAVGTCVSAERPAWHRDRVAGMGSVQGAGRGSGEVIKKPGLVCSFSRLGAVGSARLTRCSSCAAP